MNSPSARSRPTTALTVAALTCIAFALRVAVSYRAVFGQEYVAFIENDAWFHMRTVDALVRHFPWRIWYDAYLLHPAGEPVNTGPVLDWIVAGVALILGAGAPSSSLVDRVGAFVPPVIGALTLIPVFVIGRDVFSRRAGLWAAACAAVLPGEFFIRSALGYTDHHCVEVLLTTLALMIIIRAFDPSRSDNSRRILSIAAGATLWAYLLTWGGGALFVAAVSGWAVLELLRARLLDQENPAVVRVVAPAFGAAILMTMPWVGTRPYFGYDMMALVGGLGTIVALHLLAGWTAKRPRGRSLYWGAVFFGVAVAIVTVGLSTSTSLSGLVGELERLTPWKSTGYVGEAAPLMRSAAWRPVPLWNEFTTSLPLCLLGLLAGPLAGPLARPDRHLRVRLLLAWGAVTLVATFGQARFLYYLAIPVALLAGLGCDRLLGWLAWRFAGTNRGVRPTLIATMLLAVAIAAPGMSGMLRKTNISAALGPDWFDALQWMRTNTPEPFESADAYYNGSARAEAAYGVMSWWDFGYWITRVARRVPIANPRQSGVDAAASFFLSSDPAEARQILEGLRARYVIADAMLQFSVSRSPGDPGFFAGIARAGGLSPQRYCEALQPAEPSNGGPLLYCYPEYYQTMAVRLYAFAGKAITPESIWVVDIERQPGEIGRIRSEWSFATYEEALRFSQLRPAGQLRIASKDLRRSCIPVDALTDFAQVYHSVGQQQTPGTLTLTPVVQIYEFRPRG